MATVLTTAERDMLFDERRALLDRLTRVSYHDDNPRMGTLERSAERRALRQRVDEINAELDMDNSRINAVHDGLWGNR